MTLDQYISAHLSRPFVWGKNDCVLFAAEWVRLQTGRDYLAALPAWSSALEARRVLRALGGLEAELDRRLTRIRPAEGCDGDIALTGGGACIFSGARVVGPALQGLEFIDRTRVCAAWHY